MNSSPGTGIPSFFFEFNFRAREQIFVRRHFAFRDRPGTEILVLEERPARMDEKKFDVRRLCAGKAIGPRLFRAFFHSLGISQSRINRRRENFRDIAFETQRNVRIIILIGRSAIDDNVRNAALRRHAAESPLPDKPRASNQAPPPDQPASLLLRPARSLPDPNFDRS